MATLLILDASVFVGDEDAQLVAGDVAASPEVIKSSRMWWSFDDTDEEAITSKQLVMPSQYTGSGLVAILHGFFKTEVTAGETASMEVYIEAVTPNADTLDMETAESFSTANLVDVDPSDNTAGDPMSDSVTLTNADGVAVGDSFRVGIRRDIDDADDTATGDYCLYAVEIADGG